MEALVTLNRRGFAQTERKDTWWAMPLVTFIVFTSFIVYTTWAAFQNGHYRFEGYLSPLYSPELFGNPAHAWFGGKPTWWPALLPFSPALLILPFPGGFRLTCYYYRGAYYKAFWSDPPGCAVGEVNRGKYLGEAKLPLIVHNIHRYFMYAAVIFLFFLAHDAYDGMWFKGADGQTHFGIGVGTIVLTLNVCLLAGYTFGCHSLRHLVGGVFDQLSKHPVRKACYDCASAFNRKHMLWAWMSLFFVAFTDIYVRLCSMGIWHDFRIL
jgi:hypothetical protein